MSQSFVKIGDFAAPQGPHSALGGLDVLTTEQPRPPCTVCGTPAEKHGTFPTCASHPYTADENCQHVIGARCVGAECQNGCVRALGVAASGGETPPQEATDSPSGAQQHQHD